MISAPSTHPTQLTPVVETYIEALEAAVYATYQYGLMARKGSLPVLFEDYGPVKDRMESLKRARIAFRAEKDVYDVMKGTP